MVVQTGLHKIKPPVGPPRCMLLGYDGESLACVAIYEPRGMIVESGQFYIRAVARANSYRRKGVASQLLTEVLRRISETGARGAMCDIDHRNTPSQQLFRDHGFENLGVNPDDSSLEVWGVRLNEPTEQEPPETVASES
jgi:ribosomal protein S18 acetylase RimI-like enzyme